VAGHGSVRPARPQPAPLWDAHAAERIAAVRLPDYAGAERAAIASR
jgi:hypothetical protein